MAKAALTEKQDDLMQQFSNYVGRNILVLTTEYDASVSQQARDEAVTIGVNVQSLKGLEKKGYIKDLDIMWRGAKFTVVKGI